MKLSLMQERVEEEQWIIDLTESNVPAGFLCFLPLRDGEVWDGAKVLARPADCPGRVVGIRAASTNTP